MESSLGLVIRRATLALTVVLLLLAVVYLMFGWAGSWNHQTVDETALYWAGIIYVLTSFPLVAVSAVAFVALAILWLIERRGSQRVRGAAVLLAFIASPIAFAASFPSGLVRISHLDSARLGDHVYHLALRLALDGDNTYILYECDSLGLVCRSVAVGVYAPLEEIAALSTEGATNTVEVQIGSETVYTYSP